MQHSKLNVSLRIIFVLLLVFIATVGVYDFIIPDTVSVFKVNDYTENIKFPFVSFDDDLQTAKTVSDSSASGLYTKHSVNTTLFGVLPLKSVNVEVFSDIKLCPGGMPFGVKLYTKGVLVVGISGVDTPSGAKNPSADAGLTVRDIISEINGKAVNTVDEVSSLIENSNGNTLNVKILRNDKEHEIKLTPVKSTDNVYKAGLWIRDSTAGIGTVTFINPSNNAFAGLGHGICDVDTGDLMPMLKGNVSDVTINGITKGTAGHPGELKGIFNTGKTGSLIGNTEYGVYGMLTDLPTPRAEALPIALKKDIKLGKAQIYCTVNDKTEAYTAEITKINNLESEQKNFVIKITDKRLLDTTGGIVQGMSGSPIIQDGKLIGAVTHVLVNDPTRGYGIFIENMLKNMPEIIK